MADDELKIKVSTPGGREAKRTLEGIAGAERKVAGEGEKAARIGGRLKGVFTSILGALGVGTGIGAAMSKIVELSRLWAENMDRVARASREAGEDMTAFAMMQEPGTVGARAKAAVALGVSKGIKPGAAYRGIQRLQGKFKGDFPKAMKAAAASWGLAEAGVEPESAVGGVMGLMKHGLSADEAAALLYAGGEVSSLSPAEMAFAAPIGLSPYRGLGGPVVGMGLMAALSETFQEPGQLTTYSAQAGQAWMTEQGKVGRLWKRLGIKRPGVDPLAQLRALEGAGITTEQQLAREGFSEMRQRRALAALLSDVPGAELAVRQVRERASQEGLIQKELARAASESPEVAHALEVARLEAEYEAAIISAVNAPEGRAREIHQRRAGISAVGRGLGHIVPSSGKLGWWGEMGAASYGGTPAFGGGMPNITINQGGTHIHEKDYDAAGKIPRTPR